MFYEVERNWFTETGLGNRNWKVMGASLHTFIVQRAIISLDILGQWFRKEWVYILRDTFLEGSFFNYISL